MALSMNLKHSSFRGQNCGKATKMLLETLGSFIYASSSPTPQPVNAWERSKAMTTGTDMAALEESPAP